jgi:hypothetical protein
MRGNDGLPFVFLVYIVYVYKHANGFQMANVLPCRKCIDLDAHTGRLGAHIMSPLQS